MPNINDTQPVPVPILGVTTKLIDPNSVPNIKCNITLTQKSPEDIKKEEALHHSYRGYGFKACPYTITTSQGEIRDIWDMPSSVLINKLAQTIIHGDKNEKTKMRIICQNMKGHFNPSYADLAKFTKIINDYYNLTNDSNVDIAIESLKSMVQDKYNEAIQILNAQREGCPQVTCVDMVNVFEELEKQAQNSQNGISEGM